MTGFVGTFCQRSLLRWKFFVALCLAVALVIMTLTNVVEVSVNRALNPRSIRYQSFVILKPLIVDDKVTTTTVRSITGNFLTSKDKILLSSTSVFKSTVSTLAVGSNIASTSTVPFTSTLSSTSSVASTVVLAYTTTSPEVACKFPKLLVDDPEIRPFMKNYSSLRCSEEKNWVYTKDGKFYINDDAELKHGNVSCDYYDIYRKGDSTWDETKKPDFKNNSNVLGDVFRVECTADDAATYRNLHAAVAYNGDLHARKDETTTPKLDMDVYIYLLDSLSRINFLRKLPSFYELIVKNMDGTVMEGFNIVGDGTPWTMIPVCTGKFQTELYEARKRFSNASYVDGWPLIFKDYKKAGYITSYAEEQPEFSFFSYKLKGFKLFQEPPVDHYLRRYCQAVNRVSSHHKSFCLGYIPRSIALCHFWKEQQLMYAPKNKRTFAMLFSSETSHDDYSYVQVLDSHLTKVFKEQFEEGYFNNTLLIIMGDHGRRFGPVRKTQSGKMEEKLPFLALVMPPWFGDKYPLSWENLRTNALRLVSPFDIHSTLMHVLNFTQDGGMGSTSQRGISLFHEIPPERTCKDAWIKSHFCSCLDWETVSPDQADVGEAASFVVTTFNQELAAAGNACEPLRLGKVELAQSLHPNTNLLAFKESADYDNIFPDLTAKTTLTNVVYQLKLYMLPNNGSYEVSLNRFVVNDVVSFKLSMDDVSRLDMYAGQSDCILQTQPQLRQYCYCRT